MVIEVLTSENFLFYAAKNYDNPGLTSDKEFIEDIRRLKYIKKLITRYVESGELKERLILNHLIVLNNVFRPEFLSRILLLKMEEYFKYLKPFLIYLNLCPDKIYNVKYERIFDVNSINLDQRIIESLRKL